MSYTAPRSRADLPTLLMHWGLVLALLVSVSTGWRIAILTDDSAVLRWIDVLLLQGNVVRWHFISATLLTSLVLSYIVFLWRMGLGGRLAFRLSSLWVRDRTARWQAINRLVYWMAFVLLAGAAATGFLLYGAPGLVGTDGLVRVHLWLSCGFVAYTVLHVVCQIAQGGVRQLLRIVTPRLAYGLGAAVALGAGVVGATVAYVADTSSLSALVITRLVDAPDLDGDGSDAAWQATPETVVHTNRGFNLQGGEVGVHVKALHDGQSAFFLFRWQDATRSQKHVPLIKTAAGWKLLHTNYFQNDENEFYEDKFAVMLARSPVAGGNTVRLGPNPLPDRPGPTHGLGLHAATEGNLADVWHWKSVRTGVIRQFDDNHFGAPLEAKPGRYTGGYTQDPKTAGGYEQNFEKIGDGTFVKLKYLPRDLAAQQARMGRFEPAASVSDDGSFAMARADVLLYSRQLDQRVPVGTIIPSVVYDKPFEGDRGDVAVFSRWKDGWWTLEARRRLDTGSPFDQPIEDGMYMWFAVFDHNQVRHTRHIRPVRVQLQ